MKGQYTALIVMALVGAHAFPQSTDVTQVQQVDSSANTEASPGFMNRMMSTVTRPFTSIKNSFSSKPAVEFPESNIPTECFLLYNTENKGLKAKWRTTTQKLSSFTSKFGFGNQATTDPTATDAAPGEFDSVVLRKIKDVFEQVNEGDNDELLTKEPVPSDGSQLSTYALLPTETGTFAIKIMTMLQISFFNNYSAGAKGEKVRYISLDSTKSEHTRIMDTCFGPALPNNEVSSISEGDALPYMGGSEDDFPYMRVANDNLQ
ncbi:hypothetical protein BJ085DRAFT_35329 [Dimargaris cristalligena]|uniref:Uncharacterized protein n=1 Tax=Dimargaris cristalligena TaxID=215637 RepID=A0A4P9ZLR0_9FUNG|nr:hypothetical protein BJ085DRAFT_35329 [Dimargaris cristalligena]|eukprot:RKP33431.1 hypothetical protein BJ085DRAFT_35329 [Dimargaris cristalligena]